MRPGMTIDERYRCFTTSITSIVYSIQRIKNMALKEFQLRGGHISSLYYLFTHPEGLTLNELSDLAMEDKSAISRSLSQLQERGFVCCEDDGKKKYRNHYYLTEKGTGIARVLLEKIREAVSEGGSGLSEENREAFYRALTEISGSLRNYSDSLQSVPQYQ